jgi:hypothetical protein
MREFLPYIAEVFERLVELTESVCRTMDAYLIDCLFFDTVGIESCMAENTPKFMASKLRQAEALAKLTSVFDPCKGICTPQNSQRRHFKSRLASCWYRPVPLRPPH